MPKDVETEDPTQADSIAYFNRYYAYTNFIHSKEQALDTALGHTTISLSQAAAQAQMQKGDGYFDSKQYALAINAYLEALRVPSYLCEGLCKVGQCLQNALDVTQTHLNTCDIYKRHQGQSLSQNELAAVFFREVLSLAPYFKDSEALKEQSVNPYFIEAIYGLGACIQRGAKIVSQDLMNTPLSKVALLKVDRQELTLCLYQRVLRLNPAHKKAQSQLATDKKPQSPNWCATRTTQASGRALESNALTFSADLNSPTNVTPRMLCQPPALYSPPTELNLCALTSPKGLP